MLMIKINLIFLYFLSLQCYILFYGKTKLKQEYVMTLASNQRKTTETQCSVMFFCFFVFLKCFN